MNDKDNPIEESEFPDILPPLEDDMFLNPLMPLSEKFNLTQAAKFLNVGQEKIRQILNEFPEIFKNSEKKSHIWEIPSSEIRDFQRFLRTRITQLTFMKMLEDEGTSYDKISSQCYEKNIKMPWYLRLNDEPEQRYYNPTDIENFFKLIKAANMIPEKPKKENEQLLPDFENEESKKDDTSPSDEPIKETKDDLESDYDSDEDDDFYDEYFEDDPETDPVEIEPEPRITPRGKSSPRERYKSGIRDKKTMMSFKTVTKTVIISSIVGLSIVAFVFVVIYTVHWFSTSSTPTHTYTPPQNIEKTTSIYIPPVARISPEKEETVRENVEKSVKNEVEVIPPPVLQKLIKRPAYERLGESEKRVLANMDKYILGDLYLNTKGDKARQEIQEMYWHLKKAILK